MTAAEHCCWQPHEHLVQYFNPLLITAHILLAKHCTTESLTELLVGVKGRRIMWKKVNISDSATSMLIWVLGFFFVSCPL